MLFPRLSYQSVSWMTHLLYEQHTLLVCKYIKIRVGPFYSFFGRILPALYYMQYLWLSMFGNREMGRLYGYNSPQFRLLANFVLFYTCCNRVHWPNGKRLLGDLEIVMVNRHTLLDNISDIWNKVIRFHQIALAKAHWVNWQSYGMNLVKCEILLVETQTKPQSIHQTKGEEITGKGIGSFQNKCFIWKITC